MLKWFHNKNALVKLGKPEWINDRGMATKPALSKMLINIAKYYNYKC